MGPPLGHRKIILFIYVYIYIYIRNQPIYKHNGTKRAQQKNGVSSPLTPNDIFCIFLLVLQQSPVDLGVFFCRSVGRSVGLGTWAQEHQSNVHCFFYLIRCVLMCTNVYWCVPMCTDVYQCVLMCTNVYWCVPMCTAVYWSVPMCTDEYQCVPMCTDVYWSVLMCTDVYWCVLMCTDVCQCVPMCTDVYC